VPLVAVYAVRPRKDAAQSRFVSLHNAFKIHPLLVINVFRFEIIFGLSYSSRLQHLGTRGWTNMTETAELSFMQQAAGIGSSIATTGNEVVSINSNDGSVVVWNQPSGGWVSSSRPNAQLITGSPGNNLMNVAISGNVIVAGCPRAFQYGSTFLYVKPSNGWNKIGIMPTARLVGSGDFGGGGQQVAINGNTVVSTTGASVFVFVKPSSGWANMNQTATLSDTNATNDLFAVAVSGGTVVVGESRTTGGSQSFPGRGVRFPETLGRLERPDHRECGTGRERRQHRRQLGHLGSRKRRNGSRRRATSPNRLQRGARSRPRVRCAIRASGQKINLGLSEKIDWCGTAWREPGRREFPHGPETPAP
jgi:hypothetical protein